jgi:uncharacterized membrane protein
MKPNKLLGLLIVGVFLASILTAAAQMYPKALNPIVYGETTIYEFNGNPINLTATIDSLETKNNHTEVAFTLRLMSPTFDMRGVEMNASQYHKPEETGVLQYYLWSALTFDLDRNFTINAVWVNWLAGSGKDIENGYTTLDTYSHYFSLNQSGDSFHGNAVLQKFSEGVHNVTFWVTARQNYISYFNPLWAVFSKTVIFTVDTTAPTVTVMSPANQTYAADRVPLDFFVNESSPRMSYSLDGLENVTITANTTLVELPNGVHSTIIYAEDAFGNIGASEAVVFTVAKTVPSLTTLVIIITAAVVTGAGLLVYFKKYPQKKFGYNKEYQKCS